MGLPAPRAPASSPPLAPRGSFSPAPVSPEAPPRCLRASPGSVSWCIATDPHARPPDGCQRVRTMGPLPPEPLSVHAATDPSGRPTAPPSSTPSPPPGRPVPSFRALNPSIRETTTEYRYTQSIAHASARRIGSVCPPRRWGAPTAAAVGSAVSTGRTVAGASRLWDSRGRVQPDFQLRIRTLPRVPPPSVPLRRSGPSPPRARSCRGGTKGRPSSPPPPPRASTCCRAGGHGPSHDRGCSGCRGLHTHTHCQTESSKYLGCIYLISGDFKIITLFAMLYVFRKVLLQRVASWGQQQLWFLGCLGLVLAGAVAVKRGLLPALRAVLPKGWYQGWAGPTAPPERDPHCRRPSGLRFSYFFR